MVIGISRMYRMFKELVDVVVVAVVHKNLNLVVVVLWLLKNEVSPVSGVESAGRVLESFRFSIFSHTQNTTSTQHPTIHSVTSIPQLRP